MKITVESSGFRILKGHHEHSMAFVDVVAVAAEKIDKVTYDEVFLIICDRSGGRIVVGELDEGFRSLELALRERLEGFPRNRWADAEAAAVGARTEIWPLCVKAEDEIRHRND